MTTIDVPSHVQTSLTTLVDAARAGLGDDLRAIVLYGSAAEGRMRATSDVNLVVVLHRFDKERIDKIREPFRFAAAAVNAHAMFLLSEEIDAASKEFAQKFADIRRRRAVLYGDDPFAHLDIPRDALVRRLQQVLLNLTMRLREMYVERSLREEQCALAVADAAGPLRTSAAALLELEGRGTQHPKEALEMLVEDMPQFRELLPMLSAAREQRVLPQGQAADVFFATYELARALHARASRL